MLLTIQTWIPDHDRHCLFLSEQPAGHVSWLGMLDSQPNRIQNSEQSLTHNHILSPLSDISLKPAWTLGARNLIVSAFKLSCLLEAALGQGQVATLTPADDNKQHSPSCSSWPAALSSFTTHSPAWVNFVNIISSRAQDTGLLLTVTLRPPLTTAPPNTITS